MNELYIVGCFVSLGFCLGTLDEEFVKKHTLGCIILGLFICTFLSWALVIADIVCEFRKENT